MTMDARPASAFPCSSRAMPPVCQYSRVSTAPVRLVYRLAIRAARAQAQIIEIPLTILW
jgi:hypothetical protein